MITHSSWRK